MFPKGEKPENEDENDANAMIRIRPVEFVLSQSVRRKFPFLRRIYPAEKIISAAAVKNSGSCPVLRHVRLDNARLSVRPTQAEIYYVINKKQCRLLCYRPGANTVQEQMSTSQKVTHVVHVSKSQKPPVVTVYDCAKNPVLYVAEDILQ